MVQQFESLAPSDPMPGALDSLEAGVVSVDGSWRVTLWNAAAEGIFGIPRARAMGQALFTLAPALAGSPAEAVMRRAKEVGAPARVTDRHPTVPGRQLSIRAAPLRDGLILEIRDAADELRLLQSSTSLLETLQGGLVAVDGDWRILYLNGHAESLLRMRRERVQGVALWAVLPEAPAPLVEALHACRADGIRRYLKELQPEGRSFRGRVFDVWIVPLEGEVLSVLFEDVSDRVQREKELARLASEALEANQAKSRFFAAISHELRTPLNAIVGYTHLLETETYGAMPPSAIRAAERASVCAEHLSRLVDDVLLLTTVEVGRLPIFPAELDLASFLPSVVAPFRHQAESKGLAFELSVPAGLPRLETDPQRLRQLLVALLSNAIKFTHRGTVTLHVAARLDGTREGRRDEISLFPDPQMEIEVRDTGTGIDLADRQRIFGAFEQVGDAARTDSVVRGTGLGLTIAARLADLLQGNLELAESSRVGSTFRVTLPVSFPRPGV